MNIKGIYQGYKNALLKNNQDIEKEAVIRKQICLSCPKLNTKGNLLRCGVCGCPISALIRQNHKICTRWKSKL